MVSGSDSLAWVGMDNQLYVRDGQGVRRVTWPTGPGPSSGWGVSDKGNACSWPCWSPDRRWLACFHRSIDHDSAVSEVSLDVIEVDGVEERRLAAFQGRLPIYAQWSPSGEQIAVLCQDEDELLLSICEMEELGRCRDVESGAPLFFSWMPDKEGLLVHVGSRMTETSRVVVRQPSEGEDVLITDQPGAFCTPLILQGKPLYVVAQGGNSRLRMAALSSSVARCEDDDQDLFDFDGLVAMVPSPRRGQIAAASAKRGEGTPYDGVWVLEPGASAIKVWDAPCMAFFWTPDGSRLLIASLAPEEGHVTWDLIDVQSLESRTLCRFWPSRDELFFLHFFEQFTESHPPISADGRTLVFSGRLDLNHVVEQEQPGVPKVMTIDLDGEQTAPCVVAAGIFGVFPPWSKG